MWIAAAALTAVCLAAAAPQSAAPLPEPARTATAAPNPWTFSGDAGVMLIFVKPDKTADFESVLAHVKDALAGSDKPLRRQQAAGWRVFKARETGPAGVVIYVSLIDPVVKDADYSIGALLTEASGASALAADPKTSIYGKYLDAFASPAVNLLHLVRISD